VDSDAVACCVTAATALWIPVAPNPFAVLQRIAADGNIPRRSGVDVQCVRLQQGKNAICERATAGPQAPTAAAPVNCGALERSMATVLLQRMCVGRTIWGLSSCKDRYAIRIYPGRGYACLWLQ